MLLTVNGIEFGILNIATAAPAETFEMAASYCAMWPTAANELKMHKAHIFVVPRNDRDEKRAQLLERATLLTLISAAIVSITPAIGVFWPASNNLLNAEMFMTSAKLVSTSNRSPVETWVRLYVTTIPTSPDNAQRVIAATRGLRSYAGRDIEFDPGITSSIGLITQAFDIASYLIDSGAALQEGETIGEVNSPEFLVGFLENGVLAGC